MRSWRSGIDLASWAYLAVGQLAEAHELGWEIIIITIEGSAPQVLCWDLFKLGVTKKRQSCIAEAISDLTRAIEISKKVPDIHSQVTANSWLGRCYTDSGEFRGSYINIGNLPRSAFQTGCCH